MVIRSARPCTLVPTAVHAGAMGGVVVAVRVVLARTVLLVAATVVDTAVEELKFAVVVTARPELQAATTEATTTTANRWDFTPER